MLEGIIRPYQSTDVLRTRAIISSNTKIPVGPIVIEWGKIGTMPLPTEEAVPLDPSGINFTVQSCNDKFSETSRKEVIMRFSNPSDSSQFVDVAMIDTIKFRNLTENKAAGHESDLSKTLYTTQFATLPDLGQGQFTVSSGTNCSSSYKLNPPV